MLVQWLVVAALMAWSLGFVLRRYVPAIWLQSFSASLQARGFGRLAAMVAPAAKAGCDNGCSSCAPSCSSHAEAPAVPEPVKWRSSGACH
ncbi:MAG: hypothetical protein REI12_06085 [Pedobacter sp.]|nr:hypothetical protein [Pedobacter sp.]